MAHITHWLEDIFVDATLAEAEDYTLLKIYWLKFSEIFEKAFMNVAFAEADESLIV